jgi:hypothetical protein
MSLHIEGRRWFQKTSGNTYNSVKIFRDGECFASLPMEYGYGDYFMQRAQEWLGVNGYPELVERHENGCAKVCFTIWLREHKGSYSAADVSRKSDL